MEKNVFKGYAVRKLILSLTLILVLAVVSESLAAEFRSFSDNLTERVEINLNRADQHDASELMRYSHIADLKNKFPEGYVSFSSRLDSFLGRGEISLPVKVNLTDAAYPGFSGLKIIRGSYFNNRALKYGRNVAVISRDLAERLFMSIDAVGNEITLFDETYVITGLYEQSKTFVSLLGSDGSEIVYVPYTSYMGNGDLPVDTVFIHDRKLGEAGFRRSMTEDILKKVLGINAEAYRIIDYYGADTMASQWLGLLQFLVALWTAFLLLGIAGKFMRKMKDFICVGCRQDYLFEFLKKQHAPILIFTGKLLGLVGLSVILILYTRPRVFIPSDYLPADNIFDLSFYCTRVRETIQASNAMAGYTPTLMEHRLHTTSGVGFLLFILMVSAFVSLNSAIKLSKFLMYPVKRYIVLFVLSSGLSTILLLLIWISGLIDLSIGIKSVALLVLFYSVNILRKGSAHNANTVRAP